MTLLSTHYPHNRRRTSSLNKEEKTRQRKNNNFNNKPLWQKILLIGLGAVGSVFIILAIIALIWIAQAPEINEGDLQGSVASVVYDNQGNEVFETSQNERIIVEGDEISQETFDAVTSIEDRRFLKHRGVDPIRIMGSLFANLRAGGIAQGGSTLTQQLVKLSVFSTNESDRTYKRKVQELWLALQLESQFSKQEIFEYYINKVYMANGVYGIGTAANIYYGEPLTELSLDQTALLAGMPQAPNEYDPYHNPDKAKERRNTVLYTMLDNDTITQEEYQEAISQPIDHGLLPLSEQIDTNNQQKLMLDSYIQQVAADVKAAGYDLYSDGLKVYTHLDMQAQTFLHQTAEDNNGLLFDNDNIQTAVSVLDTSNSHIIALFGGRHLENQLGLNRATQLNRSVGSSIKPLSAYGPAFEYLNYSPGQTEKDEPYQYSSGTKVYNWDRQYQGTMTLRTALKNSRNIPAIKVFQDVGPERADEFLKKLGITLNDGKGLVESNAIGGEMTLLQLSVAYAAMGNNGQYNEAKAVDYFITTDGEEVDVQGESHEAMKDSTAYMLTSVLKDTFKSGLSSWIHNPNIHEAGKTGTTNYTDDQVRQLNIPAGAVPDHWASGYTKNHTVTVWTGHDEPYQANGYLTRAQQQIADRLYRQVMDHLESRNPSSDWTQPDSVHTVDLIFGSKPLRLASPGAGHSVRDLVNNELYQELKQNYGRQTTIDIDSNSYSESSEEVETYISRESESQVEESSHSRLEESHSDSELSEIEDSTSAYPKEDAPNTDRGNESGLQNPPRETPSSQREPSVSPGNSQGEGYSRRTIYRSGGDSGLPNAS
ncbi:MULTISPECIES: transglycosylase domain-containing protein [Aerococcus]|uniref:transglycosylase domain-containing protein n=1 Tax=Aerococcus TaxID=1375 RepID=UPI000DCB36BC|nr:MULTISPECIES: transglycosylase domain-containing protein [Aerococcus]KAA9299578.1 penicillin-binding protein [Aerococcus tenax]MDK6688549.1 transglycosylase domain-containing protein [Aerococcus urinae]MDK8132069.1 transglycosylase domain-containing protein [Aerococcus urinae]RAV92680.1 penicillin-binding protein [Aerococcus tenax]